ncbi:right-handed parallel beta-helix repeat-containing protein, partial [Candidatus Bathyarchaeota archaeon]|nr:right-handed parallel beta-helix repeat-containing protein [Candidatus Bathyarchaeota archaeon]
IQAVNVDIDTSNTVNGKPVYFWVDQHDKTVPADACYVALIGCNGITAKNLNLHGNFDGVFLGSTTNSTISNSKVSRNVFGVNLDAAFNNSINGNLITGNENGVNLRENSTNNIVQGNDINANTAVGIYIATSDTNNIIKNNITNNNIGIDTEYCPKTNTFLQNNLLNNTKQWYDIAFTPWPIHLEFSKGIWDDGKEGNYWSDYNGTDQNVDGIGDVPNVLGTDNIDHYPLMKPVNVTLEIPEFPDAENSTEPEPFPTVLVVASSGAAVALVSVGLLIFFKKRKHEGVLS